MNRVNRIKKGLIAFIFIGLLLSLVLSIFLFVKVLLLQKEVDTLREELGNIQVQIDQKSDVILADLEQEKDTIYVSDNDLEVVDRELAQKRKDYPF